MFTQEIKNSGAVGYKYISVDEDEAANVVYANYTLLHLGHEQIPKGSAVIIYSLLPCSEFNFVVNSACNFGVALFL